MKNVYRIISLSFLLFLNCILYGQANTYILNGSASQNSCNCYTVTQAVNWQSGSVWNAAKINLNNPFDFIFNVYLGCVDGNGADGIVFMLQPISTSIGTSGAGMGFQGVTPSIGIALDTWQNTDLNDPAFDHISIQANGNPNHSGDLAGPVQASSANANIEDCQWHTFRIVWDPVTKVIATYVDGQFRLQATVDLIATIFNNDPMVYWGFSGATGGANNLQQFCTALNPKFTTSISGDGVCLGTPVSFTNTSESFTTISSYYWNFGDNTSSTAANPPPHLYATPGQYEIKLAIAAADGCLSDTIRKTIVVGDFPVADFVLYDTCAGSPPRISDQSSVQYGSITQWQWSLDGSPVSNSQQPQLTGLTAGPHLLALIVTSNYGCASAPVIKTFTVLPRPVITASGNNGCVNELISFSASQIDNATMISSWNWNFGNSQQAAVQNPQQLFTAGGDYTAQVTATADNGCKSAPFPVQFFVTQLIADAGNDTTVIKDEPFPLQSSVTVLGNTATSLNYNWSPAVGLNNTTILSPVAILQDDQSYSFTATSAEGCEASDLISITVFKGSAIYVASGFTPNDDGLNDLLKPYYIGIKKLDYFSIFNRWGEVVFTTKNLSAGWNGSYKGMKQPTGTFVWMVRATDFAGKVIQQKGTTTIIR
jgi:gliding motility-associated-like protein